MKAAQRLPQYLNLPQHLKVSTFIFTLLVMIKLSQGLIQVPVAQRSSILGYSSSLQYTHAYFDISFTTSGELVQNDDNCTYFFSKTSPRSISTYQFVKINNTDLTATIVNTSIILVDYQIFGMCQYNGSLDYVIGRELNSNELRVIRFTQDSQNVNSVILDYKVIDRDPKMTPLTGNVYVDCKYYSTYNAVNTYVIAVAGSYFSQRGLTSYYLAKFSTKYNMTEYIITSGNYASSAAMEQVRAVKIDLSNEMIYLALEVNKNKYNGRTVYAPGALPGKDNANVAILAYSWQWGVLEWTTVLGNPTYQDEFAGMDVWGNSLYVFTNSFSTQYSTNSSQTDIYYYRMRHQNGYIESFKIFGSPKDDKIYDVVATFNGVYALALINNYLLPHKYNDRVWQTQNQTSNIAIILFDFFDDILDIEGYSLDQAPNPYPTKLQVYRQGDHRHSFMLASHRDFSVSGYNAGIFFTKFNDSSAMFVQSTLCKDSLCSRCSPQNVSQCLQCGSGSFLWQHQCYQTQCPNKAFSVWDQGLNLLHYCKNCHPSCKTCTGSKRDQCSSCCINNNCGSINNRVPSLGKCLCPVGLTDSNGLCVQRCIINLAGKRQQMCYPQCPQNSYPSIKYDQAIPQERSQYDLNSQTDCALFSNHLKFSLSGKGLPINGPSYLQGMPSEFTMAFWVRPTALNAASYLVNAFGRVQIKVSSSNSQVQFLYKTGTTNTIEPIYATTSSMRSIVLGAWNYISVALRSPQGIYEMQMAISNSNTGSMMNSGYSNINPYVYFPDFINTIYLGSYSDSSPQSFAGYLKEFKIFNIYHGYAQMQIEQMRLYRLYSYDDPHLVAYWKLGEAYTSNDYEYTIYDYSIYMNSISYSYISEPDYPQFVQDQSNTLSLCTFHDVAICKSLDYSESHPYLTSARRFTQPPTFVLKDFSYAKTDGDQLWIQPNNTVCSSSNIAALMTYRQGIINDFVIENSALSPLLLVEGIHYQVCYYISAEKVAFNLYQVYLMKQPLTINPSNSHSFQIAGAAIKWMITGGDQGYNEIIQFSENCDQPKSTDFAMQRTVNPNYGTQSTTNFAAQGEFYFCWQPTYLLETGTPFFEPIHYLKYTIVQSPVVSSASPNIVNVNVDLIKFDLTGAFVDGDKLAFAWSGLPLADCRPTNFLGQQYTYNYSHWPAVWFGQNSGVYGVANRTMDMLHMCYYSNANNAPGAWVRVKLTTQDTYDIKVQQFNSMPNTKCPELLSFKPTYGSTELYETATAINFNFLNQAVYPSRSSDLPLIYGKIIIYRGAIFPDGSIQKTSQILWSQIVLDDYHSPDPFQQGDLICTQTGQCSILLSTTTSRMKAGEIYYLSFYQNTFSSHSATTPPFTRYYLFYNKTLSVGQTSAYDHLFFCRSFDVSYASNMINGKYLMIYGVDLLSKTIKSVAFNGGINTATFTTKAINLKLSVLNTADELCTASPPTATVVMTDVTQTSFAIKNLDLGQCNQGALFAEIELIRGIQDQYGAFTHERAEQLKNIQFGIIGCDPTCRQCNGTSPNNCIICSDPAAFLYKGACYSQCPSNVPVYQSTEIIFQKIKWQQFFCLAVCPAGTYSTSFHGQCIQCNAECQTCASSDTASCLSCTPIKYLFNGICVPSCPNPHHQNNLTSYTCDQISQSNGLSVKIASLGYKTRIPKADQAYLKAAISNDDVSTIVNILWTQIEPIPTSSSQVIFTKKDDGNLDISDSVAKLSMTAFNFMPSDQVVKVQCTVQNSFNEIAYDIYEFYFNDPPVEGNTTLSVISGSGNGTSFDSWYLINMTGWSDQRDGTFLSSIYITYGDTSYIQVTDQTLDNLIYFRLPLFSRTASIQNISICIDAQDSDEGVTTSCKAKWNVGNTLSYVSDTNKLISKLIGLNYTLNLTNALFAANSLYYGIKAPYRDPSLPGICTLDFHCNMNGQCQAFLGAQTCQCNQGYQGSFCQFSGSQLQQLNNITHRILATLANDNILMFIGSVDEISRFDIILIGSILRGIQVDPDILLDDDIDIVIQIHEAVGQGELFAHQPLTQRQKNLYLDSLSTTYLKIYHSRKSQRAVSNVVSLGQGKTLQDQYLYINSLNTAGTTSRRLQAVENNEATNNEYIMNEGPQSDLIGGKQQSGQLRHLELTASDQQVFQSYGRRMTSQINMFIENTFRNLNPINTGYTYTSKAFQIKAQADYATIFKNIQVFILEMDTYWTLPSQIFDNSQGSASDLQYINMLAMKWLANPFLLEMNPGGYVETNVTTFSFFDINSQEISLQFPDGVFIEIREPWNQTQSFDVNGLRCMAWDEDGQQFDNDGSCAFAQIWDVLPCLSCGSNDFVNTTIAMCRCKHLSTFAAVYEQTVTGQGAGPLIGLYSNFFALQYWRNSFGYYVVIVGTCVYTVGIIIMILIDRKAIPRMNAKLRSKIRKLELRGFIQIEDHEIDQALKEQREAEALTAKNADDNEKQENQGPLFSESPKKNQKGGKYEDAVEEFKFGQVVTMNSPSKVTENGKKNMGKKLLTKKGGKKLEDKDQSLDLSSRRQLMPIKTKKLPSKTKGKVGAADDNMVEHQYDKHNNEDFNGMSPNKSIKKNNQDQDPQINEEYNFANEDEHRILDSEEVKDALHQELQHRYEEEEKRRKMKKEHVLNSTEEDEEGKTSMLERQKKYKKQEAKRFEKYFFKLKTMMIHGSAVPSIIYVTSIITPRHIRWTTFFVNIVLNCFWCAVIYNNTQDPLKLPDSNRKARNVAYKDLWISVVSPVGSIILMYVFAGLFKISDARISKSFTSVYLEKMLFELKKEMKLRYVLAYSITIGFFAACCYYIVQFSSTFGWKTSWVWWYSCLFALFIQFFILDPLMTLTHWVIYKCSRQFALFIMKIRWLKQTKSEAE